MMIHPATNTFSRYLDGELTAVQAKKLTRHLERCEGCQKRLRTLQNMESAFAVKELMAGDFQQAFLASLGDVTRIKQPTCGEIKAIVGRAMVTRNGAEQGVKGFPGMALKKGDMVRLMGKSVALVELNDGSSIYLNKDTEIGFEMQRPALALRAGELFAMMKPQRKPFEIKTPSAVLGVVGTDFDAQVTEKKATVLKVLKGKVTFQNDAGKTVVKRSQQVEASSHLRPAPTQIKEVQSITNWTKPVNAERVRGGTGLKNLGYLVVLGSLILAGLWYFGKQQEPAAPEVVKVEKTEPLTLRSPYQEEGLSWRLRINDQIKRGSTHWIPVIHTMVIRSEVLEVDEENGSRVLVTLEDTKEAEGLSETEAAEKIIGRQFEYQVSPEGKFHSSATANGKAFKWDEISPFAMAVWGTDFSGVYLKNPMLPGDQWTGQLEDKIPGYPNSYAKGVASYEFVGYELRDGVEYGVVRAQILVSLGGGLPLEKTVEPRATTYLQLDKMNMSIQGEYLVDVENGRVASASNSITRGGIKATVTSIIQGRRVPVTETIEQETGVVIHSFTKVEYLP